jgi:uncharacterized protein YegL
MLVLDTSGSMSGQPIQELSQGIVDFIHSVQRDDIAALSVELSIITFGGTVSEVMPFTTMAEVSIHQPSLPADGQTPMGQAVFLALQRLEERKEAYKKVGAAYYQPWMVLISDGAPTDDWEVAADKARALSANRKLVALPVGVANADMNILGRFSSKPAVHLQGVKFGALFEWLSQSMSRVSASNSTSAGVALPPTDSWSSI